LGNLFQKALRYRHVFFEVDRGYPQADDLPTQAIGDLDRIDAVAQSLGRGAALRIERPAVRGYCAIGRLVARADGAEQGGVEPRAILVSAFEIKIGGPWEIGLAAEDRGVTAS